MAYDILGLGCVAWDQLLYLRQLPAENQQAEIVRRGEQLGGTTGTALCAAARYGVPTAWAGIVGEDEVSSRVLAALTAAGVNLDHVQRQPDAGVIQTVVLVNTRRHTRTVLYELGDARPCAVDYPSDSVITAAKVLLIDQFGVEGMLRAVRLAQQQQIPVVADFSHSDREGFEELLADVGHLILSAPFACELTGASDPAAAVSRLWNDARQAVVVTCGAAGCWYRDPSLPSWATHHFPAPDVDAVDTTGCGDVFHGIYAAALTAGLTMEGRLQRATIAAAIKATRYAGLDSLPSRAEVDEFAQRWSG